MISTLHLNEFSSTQQPLNLKLDSRVHYFCPTVTYDGDDDDDDDDGETSSISSSLAPSISHSVVR